MKILYHHRTRGKRVEGVHIRSICKALEEKGHEVEIMAFPGSEAVETSNKLQDDKGSTLGRFLKSFTQYAPEFIFELMEMAYNFVVYYRIKKYIKKDKVDLIYERYSLFMYYTVKLARKNNIPVILEINDSALVERVRHLFFVAIAKKFESWIFRNADGLVFISNEFKKIASTNYTLTNHMCVSPNAADPQQFSRDKYDRRTIRKQLGIESGIVCGYVGAFHHWHGIHIFIDKVIPVMKKNPDTYMLMIGDGELLDDIKGIVEENHLQDKFIFTSRIPHDEVPHYIAAMDIAVLPDSNVYGSPMKIFEYMAMEVPVVAPDYSPIGEVIKSGETGWLFHKNDFNDCVQLFEKLLNDLDEIRRVGKNAREYIIKERQWSNNAEDIIDMYARIKQ